MFCSFKKGPTPKIHVLCFVVINIVLFNFVAVVVGGGGGSGGGGGGSGGGGGGVFGAQFCIQNDQKQGQPIYK